MAAEAEISSAKQHADSLRSVREQEGAGLESVTDPHLWSRALTGTSQDPVETRSRDPLRRLPTSSSTRTMLLQMQQVHGNQHTQRLIAQRRDANLSPEGLTAGEPETQSTVSDRESGYATRQPVTIIGDLKTSSTSHPGVSVVTRLPRSVESARGNVPGNGRVGEGGPPIGARSAPRSSFSRHLVDHAPASPGEAIGAAEIEQVDAEEVEVVESPGRVQRSAAAPLPPPASDERSDRLSDSGDVDAARLDSPELAQTADAQSSEAIQREGDDEEGGGLLASALSLATNAWNSLKQQASGALNGLKEGIAGRVAGLQSLFEAMSGQLGGVWDALKNGAQGLWQAAEGQGAGLLSGIVGQISALGSALVSLDAEKVRAAWGALTGSAGQAWNAIKGVASGAAAQLLGQWEPVKGVADGLIGGLRNQAEGILSAVPDAVGSVQSQLGGAWESITSAVPSLLRKLPGWSTIEQGWTSLKSGIATTASSVASGANSVWQGIQTRAGAVWQGVQMGWSQTQAWASQKAKQLVGGFERITGSLKTSAISSVIETISKLSGFFAAAKEAMANPDSVIDPIAQDITARLAVLPEQAPVEAQTRLEAAGAGAPSAPGATASAPPIQRQAVPTAAVGGKRRSAGIGEILSGVLISLKQKVLALAGSLGEHVKQMVLEMVYPPATWEALKRDWHEMTEQLGKRADRVSSIRTDDANHFAEDLNRYISNLIDFPLIIWRSVNAMLGRFAVYITVLLVLVGAGAGLVGGSVGGAILSALSGGTATAVALPGGTAAGTAAGAGIGFAAATKIGLPLFLSFIAAEVTTIAKLVYDLFLVSQDEDERGEDLSQIADSVIGLTIAGILALLTWIASKIAGAFINIVRRIVGKFRGTPVEAPPIDDASVGAQEAVPGKLRFEADVRVARQRLTRLQERLAEMNRADRATLQPEADALNAEFTRLQEQGANVERPQQVQNLRESLDAANERLGKLEKSPLLELGLRGAAIEAIENLERAKRDPIGDINSELSDRGNPKNHYNAARKEAAGEIVARKPDGRPFDHIQDLQQAHNRLENIRAILEAEAERPAAGMTERGLSVLVDRQKEVQNILSRLKGFLSEIGHGPPYPPFHEFPPGI